MGGNMFEIKCLKCGKSVVFNNGLNDENQIEITGEVEVLFDADVFIECNCGNKITIEK
jgi:DNA-directed RNA polymerase subunit RPC12/RpoP